MPERDRKVAKKLLLMNMGMETTMGDLFEWFNDVMLANGIDQTTPMYKDGKYVGESGDNFEWTLYKTLFLERVRSWMELYMMFHTEFNHDEEL